MTPLESYKERCKATLGASVEELTIAEIAKVERVSNALVRKVLADLPVKPNGKKLKAVTYTVLDSLKIHNRIYTNA